MPGSGPSTSQMDDAGKQRSTNGPRFALIPVSPLVVSAMEKWPSPTLSSSFGQTTPVVTQKIGIGDTVQIVIWDASGGLFSTPITDRLSPGSKSTAIPEQVVGQDGAITIPYAGRIKAAGLTPDMVEKAIVQALAGKADQPQAVVTVTKNVANTVTVIGEVTAGARIPLTLRGDRILDVIAAAGGIRIPAQDVSVTLIRSGRSTRVPMQAILTNPSENIPVEPGDVITVARDPQTFTAVGATAQSAVVPFENVGFTLEEAIAKVGGLNDLRADPQGVFVIRYEPAALYDSLGFARPSPEPEDRVPTVYQVNMRDPNAFFLARRFPIRNKDILYVSNATAAEIQKLFAIINTLLVPGATVVGVAAVAKR